MTSELGALGHPVGGKEKEKSPEYRDSPATLPLAISPMSLSRHNHLQECKSRLYWKLRQESTGNSLAVRDSTWLG